MSVLYRFMVIQLHIRQGRTVGNGEQDEDPGQKRRNEMLKFLELNDDMIMLILDKLEKKSLTWLCQVCKATRDHDYSMIRLSKDSRP